MKKCILIVIVFICTNSHPQQQVADLIIPIQITFQSGNSPINMEIGLDSVATNCIDPQLGESQLPPIPPPGWEAVLQLPYPECQGSYGDL
jgi:hypothetical protein